MILQHYIKIAFRNLAKYKVQSAISIVGLAIGLICFTYGWNWYRYETNYDGFYPQSGQIYRIYGIDKQTGKKSEELPLILARKLKKDFPEVIETTQIYSKYGSTFKYGETRLEDPDEEFIDEQYFKFFPRPVICGKRDDILKTLDEIAITRSFAVKYFKTPEEALGKTLENGYRKSITIVSVLEDSPNNSIMQADVYELDKFEETSAKMLATCLHMMQGTPYVYQGEELGMTNIYFDKLEDYRDIESINFFTEFTESGLMTPEYMMKCLMLRSRDNARTPMQWNDSKQAGFTDGEPWIKVNPNYKEINAAQQLEDPNSIFHYYQKLIRLRKEKDIIVYGGFEPLYRDDEQIFAYTRKQDQEKLLTVCNFSDQNAEVEVPEEFKDAECLITNLGRKVFEAKTVLKPYEAFVLYKK